MAKKVMLVKSSCSASGAPTRTNPPTSLSRRMSRMEKEKGSFCRRMIKSERITLTACAPMVAMAAPATFISSTATSTRSPTMLTTQAMPTNMSGSRELPSPRKMQLIRL